MKSLTNFPKNKAKIFDPLDYGIECREQVAVKSRYQGDVGIEIELEGNHLPHSGCTAVGNVQWVYHNDGSLRAVGGIGAGGAEYVLSEPIGTADVRTATENLFRFLVMDSKATIQNSTRCSTHVHLNMQDMKVNQLASFVSLWAMFEDALSVWCGSHRAGNHFAVRLSDSNEAVDAWVRAFRVGNFHFPRERRYLALNPHCLQTFGSLEVRLMGGIESPEPLVSWVDWLSRIKTAAKSPRFSNPETIAAEFSGYGARAFATDILGAEAVRELEQACVAAEEDFEALIFQGFRRIQPVCFALPWQPVIDEASQPFVPSPFGAPVRRRRISAVDEFVMMDEGPEMDIEDFDR